MADAAVVYKAEGHIGDEVTIAVGLGETSTRGFELYYQLQNIKTQKDLAWVKTGIVCFDYQKGKVASMPQPFKDALREQWNIEV